jgi:signal transduction histidine kinase
VAKPHPDALNLESAQSDVALLNASVELSAAQQGPLRALVHSLAHDLAQPLTSVRCFLEMMDMQNNRSALQTEDLKNIELQADRAISLVKGISALVREAPAPAVPWTSLDGLLNDIFNDFLVLIHAGLLTLDRQGAASIQVTSNPVLRQVIVLFLSKLVGRNATPLLLTVTAQARDGECALEFLWKSNLNAQPAAPNAKNILSKELAHVQELVRGIGGEVVLSEEGSKIALKIPAAPQKPRPELLN